MGHKRDRGATSPYLLRRRRSFEEAQADSARTHAGEPAEVVPRTERTDNRSFGDDI